MDVARRRDRTAARSAASASRSATRRLATATTTGRHSSNRSVHPWAYFSTNQSFTPVTEARRKHAAQRDQHHRGDVFDMLLERAHTRPR